MSWLRRLLQRFRERRLLRKLGCLLFCPNCDNIINADNSWVDTFEPSIHAYRCEKCGTRSWFRFDAPVPLRCDRHGVLLAPEEPRG